MPHQACFFFTTHLTRPDPTSPDQGLQGSVSDRIAVAPLWSLLVPPQTTGRRPIIRDHVRQHLWVQSTSTSTRGAYVRVDIIVSVRVVDSDGDEVVTAGTQAHTTDDDSSDL